MRTFILNSSLLTLKQTSDSVRWRKVLGRSTRTKCMFPGKEPWKREERNVLALIQSVCLCSRQQEKIKKNWQPHSQVSRIFCVFCKKLYRHFHENPNLNTSVKNKTPNVILRLYFHFSIHHIYYIYCRALSIVVPFINQSVLSWRICAVTLEYVRQAFLHSTVTS